MCQTSTDIARQDLGIESGGAAAVDNDSGGLLGLGGGCPEHRILLLWSGPLAAIALFVWNILRFRRDIRRTVAALRKIWEAGEPEPLP